MEMIDAQENTTLKSNKVEFRKVRVQDLNKAEKIAGAAEGIKYTAALLSLVCTFDGRKLVMEELEQLEANDFLLLSRKLLNTNLGNSGNQLSSLPDTQDSASSQ